MPRPRNGCDSRYPLHILIYKLILLYVWKKQLDKEGEKQAPDNEKIENAPTKKTAQQELHKKFGIINTAAFREALQQGNTNTAKEWLQYIVNNQEKFPQYQATWDNWLKDRWQEISQQELFDKFGMRKTNDFCQAIREGKVNKAKEWLQYIIDNRDQFPQYNDSWLEDRQKELEQA